MSIKNPIDLRQDRREWLKTSATLLGATLLPATMEGSQAPAAEPQPSQAATASTAKEASSAVKPFFTPAQHELVAELSETIIPADDRSGGAKAAKVADYIDQVLRETTDDSKRTLWREGLPLIDSMSQHYHGQPFVKCSPEQRIAVLQVLSDHSGLTDLPEVRLFNSLKELTVTGYYTSKIGIHDELQYKGNRILQQYVGCDNQDQISS
jgi:hypothetical protein